ncbi:hypothetical protein [Flaviflexus equikiangi]|uniref:Uncharacterized protein n=1 Tax=Flaviflexus equikiangi TaxID=2758573 RepID=A0ABS2TFE5_9ACTO|nr:hypothetical protein [Flaviflexus equikiangi]MBM9433384.1 hypothetical protein [Flaviflexus equikiangi]
MDCSPIITVSLDDPLYHDPREDLVVVSRDHAVPRDLCQTPAMRARAVYAHVRSRAVLVDESAVFVYTGVWTINPRVIRQLPTAPLPGRSTRWTSDRRLLKDDHIVFFGEVPVTTMVRTAADLLYQPPLRAVTSILPLLRAGLDPGDVIEFMGERFRGHPTDDASRLIEQLGATVARHRSSR